MMLARQGLGIIPDWQFSTDPSINPNVNPNVVYPPGWNQLYPTQPVGPIYGPPQLSGLIDDVGSNVSAATGLVTDAVCQQSFICRNKWWLLLGGVGLVGVAVIGLRR